MQGLPAKASGCRSRGPARPDAPIPGLDFPRPIVPVQAPGAMSQSFDRPEIPATGIMAGLEADDRRLLGDYGEFLPVHPGQLLIREGGGQDSLYFVISGVLEVHLETRDKRTMVAELGSGETIGEVNVFDPAVASASVTARVFSQLWRADRNDLEQFAESYPAAAARLMAGIVTSLSSRLRRMNQKFAAREIEGAFHSFWS